MNAGNIALYQVKQQLWKKSLAYTAYRQLKDPCRD